MPTWVGVDIGTAAVKVAVLKSAYRKLQLTGLAAADIAPGGSVEDAVRSAFALALGPKGHADSVTTSLPGTLSTLRTLTLPLSVQKQVREVLTFELDSLLPFDVTESVFDHRPLSAARPPDTGAEQMSLSVAVARIDDVRRLIALVKAGAGQEPERVAPGAAPLGNLPALIPNVDARETLAMVDIGQKTTDLLITKGGEPAFARTLSFGTQGLPASAGRLAREIRTSFAAFRAQGGEAPARVCLIGGGAFVSGAEAFLQGELEIPTQAISGLSLEMVGIDESQLRSLPRYAKAIALALDSGKGAGPLNLRRGPLSFERGFAWVREKIPMLAGLAVAIAVSFLFAAWAQLYSAGKERASLEKALGTVTKEVLGEETESAERAKELLTKQTAINDEDPLPHADAFDVVVRISEAIPQSMVHDIDELDIQKGHVIITGIVGSTTDAQSIQSSLKSERCFQDVKITRTTQVVGGERQKYVMEFDLKCPEDIKGQKKPTTSTTTTADKPAASGGK
jgi:general secretion pathway protein L